MRASVRKARKGGYRLRPSQPKLKLSKRQAQRLLAINDALAAQCDYSSVQKAVLDAGNNDRILIMPGRYTEPASRKAPENDPKCNPSLLQRDASGDLTPSYEYQVTCPNDQNLIYVQGRAVTGDPPVPPLSNRQGIPAQELGRCVRCNLQIEGTGPKPEDVIMDAGTGYRVELFAGKRPGAKPSGYAKHVVLRVDRADGFVGRNFLVRGAREHTFYNEELDGILLDRVKFFWGADYGHLSFTSDHSLVQNCDGFGAGDAAVYPGAAPETGSQATDFYPDAPRANTVIRDCDLHGSALGYSGSMGNAVRITHNHIYGNMTGISSDTLSAAGHPGFPADSSEIDHNYIYANNLDLYTDHPHVSPLVAVPIGTGIIYAGMNDARVHHNWIFDNWRDGAMLFAVPDSLVNGGGAEGDIFPGRLVPGCAGQRAVDLMRQPVLPKQRWQSAEGLPLPGCDRHVRQRAHIWCGAEEAERQRLLVGRVVYAQHRELLVPEHRRRRDRGQRDRSRRRGASPGNPASGTAVELRHQHRQRRRGQALIPDRLRERTRRGHRAHGL